MNKAKGLKYEAQVANVNAGFDREAAADALQRGQVAEAQQYRRTAQLMGQQRAAIASNGIEIDGGSAAAVQADTRQVGWEDASTIRQNALRESRGYTIQAFNDTMDAKAKRAAGNAAYVSTAFDAGSTLLSGAKQVAGIRAGQAGK